MRVCARSDCSLPAAAILAYDRVAQTAYLYAIDDPSKRTPGDLCDRHLRRLVLPRAWALDDRRDAAGNADPVVVSETPRTEKLRVVPAAALPTAKPRTAKPRTAKPRTAKSRSAARRKWAEVEPSLFETPASDVAALPADAVDEAAESSEPVWMPRFGPDTELDDVVDAQTPLLRRAFGGR